MRSGKPEEVHARAQRKLRASHCPPTMKQPLQPYEKAARVIRLMGWLGLLFAVGIGAAVLLPALNTERSLPAEMYGVLTVLLAIPVSLFFVARGIFARRDWARWAGIAYGVLSLLGVPIGTVIGAYVLWQLSKGWPGEA